jgi:hypothetical protein
MNVVAASLQGLAASTRVLFLPDLPDKGDIIDWAANGGTVEQLHNLIGNAPHWMPPLDGAADTAESGAKATAERKEDKLLEALARLRPGVEFAQQRKKAARELGVRASDIDAEIEARRSEKAVAPLYGHWITEPWPEVADGDALLRDIVRRILSHIVCTHDDALAMALWLMLAWIHEAVTHSPLLLVTSAQRKAARVPRLVWSNSWRHAAWRRSRSARRRCFVPSSGGSRPLRSTSSTACSLATTRPDCVPPSILATPAVRASSAALNPISPPSNSRHSARKLSAWLVANCRMLH